MPVMQRRAQDTRSALLQSARLIFVDVGYSDANVAEVVARAGSSVGSMYHHFGGKADLFLALHDEHKARQEARADAAVREIRAAGERNPVRVFAAGARAFLQGAWEERDLARLFLAGDGPPGFDAVMRAGFGDWVRRSEAVLRGVPRGTGSTGGVSGGSTGGGGPVGVPAVRPAEGTGNAPSGGPAAGPTNQAYPLVLATVIAAGAREVTQQPDEATAMAFADDVLKLLDKFTTE